MVNLYNGDCMEFMKGLPSGSIQAVITDPPYGILPTAWDKKPDFTVLMPEVVRIASDFFVSFAMMPLLVEIHASTGGLPMKLVEHVVWIKRNATPGGTAERLKRGHESIVMYSIGKKVKQFHITRGPFQDVKIPGIGLDVFTLEGLQRHYYDLELIARRGYGSVRKGDSKTSKEHIRYARGKACANSGADANFTNVWSFLPPGSASRQGSPLHGTQKPIEIMKRLVEMCTPPGGTVFDPFMGSGTTGVACMQTGRNFIGCEIDVNYFAIAQRRIEDAQAQLHLFAPEPVGNAQRA